MTKMSRATLRALKASIRHWQDNVEAEMPQQASTGESGCALCANFIAEECQGCPVKQKTGRKYCDRSPYRRARAAYVKWAEYNSLVNHTKFRAAAQAELDFLRSLLPTGEP